MPCYHPVPAWYAKRVNESGKRGITFTVEDGFKDKQLEIPCGRCIGCRLERAREWAVRCMHEAKQWEQNCFVTLTYDDKYLPDGGTLVPRHYVLFMKRLRAKYGGGIRFFHCGEYGGKFERPHHHAILFNHDFEDKWFYNYSGNDKLYTSKSLDELWGYGFCTVGSATFESAGYIARYSLKKVNGTAAAKHYNGRVPEYLTMSRRPGIGNDFARQYLRETYLSDSCIVNGAECKPPRYYDKVCEKESPGILRRVKARRRAAAAENPDNSGRRLLDREVVKIAAISSLGNKGDVKVVKPGPLPW